MSAEKTSDYLATHERSDKKILEKQTDEKGVYDLVELFKVLGDPTNTLFESELL